MFSPAQGYMLDSAFSTIPADAAIAYEIGGMGAGLFGGTIAAGLGTAFILSSLIDNYGESYIKSELGNALQNVHGFNINDGAINSAINNIFATAKENPTSRPSDWSYHLGEGKPISGFGLPVGFKLPFDVPSGSVDLRPEIGIAKGSPFGPHFGFDGHKPIVLPSVPKRKPVVVPSKIARHTRSIRPFYNQKLF